MTKKTIIIACAGVAVLALVAATVYFLTRPTLPTEEFRIRSVVNGFGDEIGQVSLSTTSSAISASIDKHYALYIRPDLLDQWKAAPLSAPGRKTGSPQPDRIDIQTVTKNADDTYTIDAVLATRANAQASSTAPGNIPVRLIVSMGPDGWQISQYTVVTPTVP